MTTQELIPHGQRTLEEISADVNRGQQNVAHSLATALHWAIRTGDALLEARAQVPGRFIEWLNTETSVSHANAKIYMRLAEYQHLLPDRIIQPANGIQQPSIRDAITYLRAIGVTRDGTRGRPPAVDRAEVRRLRDSGASLDEIAKLTGVTRNTVRRALLTPAERSRENAASNRAWRERNKAVQQARAARELKATSDDLAEAYTLVRRALQRLDAALPSTTGNRRRSVSAAITSLHAAEDSLTNASKQTTT